MNRDRLHGMWQQIRGAVKQQWGILSGNPLAVVAGARDRRGGRNEARSGMAKEAMERQLANFIMRNRNWWDSSRH